MPVFPCRCFGLMPSSAIFGLSRQPQQRPLGFRDLLAQVLFQDPVHPRPHPPFSRQPSVVFPSDRLGTATSPGSDNCFPTSSGAIKDSPVWFPPGRARLATNLIIADPLKGQRGSSFLLPPVLPELPAPGESRRMI